MALNILISSVPCSENQQNIIVTFTFDIHHITWQERKKHYEVRTKKLKWGNLVPFYVHLSILKFVLGSNSRAYSSLVIPNPICIIYGENDVIESVHAAGAFHASKLKLNSEHVMKLRNNWRDITFYIGDNALVNSLMIGDLGANSSFYHKRCSTNLYN